MRFIPNTDDIFSKQNLQFLQTPVPAICKQIPTLFPISRSDFITINWNINRVHKKGIPDDFVDLKELDPLKAPAL